MRATHQPERGAEYQTVRDAAVIFGLSEASLRYLIRAGKIPVLRVGRRIHVQMEGARKALNDLTTKEPAKENRT